MKKWLPFISLLLLILLLIIFLIFTGNSDDYFPKTDDSAQIYLEACARCHGKYGKGEGILYPDLVVQLYDEEDVIEIVKNGRLFMPSFPQIPDTTLKKLARYVVSGGYTIKKKAAQ